MIRHVILYKFRDSVSIEQKKQAVDMLRSLGKSISQVREWSIGQQAFPSEKAFDLAQVSSFDNLELLEHFRSNARHIEVRNYLSRIADWIVVDYEC